ncbi:MAG: hypothetical protein H7Y02_12205 [Candidatus Obscuribacterales bacterium]|nr:hypothetical protein [Steroidobacteraceae bacterium]
MPSSSLQLLVTIAAIALLVLAARLYNRTHTPEDFLVGRRRLPATTVALSSALTQLPPWLLFAIAVLAYQLGLAASWIALAAWLGTAVGMLWVAPHAQQHAKRQQAYSISCVLHADTGERLQVAIRRSIAGVVVFSLSVAIGAQLQWLSSMLANMTGAPVWLILCSSAAVLLMSTLLGGLWVAVVADAVVAIALLLLSVGIAIAAANSGGLPSLAQLSAPSLRPQAWGDNVLLIALVVGVFFLIASALAQPAALTRHLATHVENPQRSKWLALTWGALMLWLALLIGWCARAQSGEADALLRFEQWLPQPIAHYVWVSLLCAGVAAQLSNCIAMAGLLGHDWTYRSPNTLGSENLLWYRWALAFVIALAVLVAFSLTTTSFEAMWFAWHAMGASLAPLLIVRLSGKRVRPDSMLGSIWAGFALTIIFHVMPDTPGDLMERGLPFITALGIALSGGDQRRNPDRADRGQQTVHDRLPI